MLRERGETVSPAGKIQNNVYPYTWIGFAILCPLMLPVIEGSEKWRITSHIVLELLSILLCAMIFVIGWLSITKEAKRNIVGLSSLFAAIALLDLAHLLSIRGMPDFITPKDPNKAFLFSLASRIVAAISLAWYLFLPNQPFRRARLRYLVLVGGVCFTGIFCWININHSDWLSAVMHSGEFVSIKVCVEASIVILNVVLAVFISRRALQSEVAGLGLMFWAMLLAISAESALTLGRTSVESYVIY